MKSLLLSALGFVLLLSPVASDTTCKDVIHRYFILRHGETDANAKGIIQGSSNFSQLTDLGRQQAVQVGKVVSTLGPFHAVYVSPLARALDTLGFIRQEASKLPSETVWNELRELDFYDWEGRSKTDLQGNDAEAWKAWKQGRSYDLVVSGKRPLVDVWERAASVWKQLRQDESKATTTTTTLLVCHGTLGQALINAALGRNASYFRDISVPNCGLVELEWPVGSPTAVRWKWHHPEPSRRWVLEEWEQEQKVETTK